jgi:fatty acid desaturase
MVEVSSIGRFKPVQLQPLRWLATASINWLWILLAFVVLGELGWPDALWFLPLALIVIGTRQHALALLAHDGAHYLCSRNRALNDVLSTVLCAYPLTASLRSYRRFHLDHHRYVGTADDPEFEYKRGMAPRWDLPIARRQVYLQFLKDCLGLGVADIVQTVKTLRPIDVSDAASLAAFWISATAILAFTGNLWCIAVWFLALNTVQWAVFRVRTWTEHSGLAVGLTHRLRATWWERFLFLPTNTWCHYEHHESASTPFYRLPELRRSLGEAPTLVSLSELFDLFGRMSPCASGEVPCRATAVDVWLPGTLTPAPDVGSRSRTQR